MRLEATTPVPLPGTPTVRPGTGTPVPLPDAVTVPLHVADAPTPIVPLEAAVPVPVPEALTVPLEGALASDVPPEPGSPAGPATKERA